MRFSKCLQWAILALFIPQLLCASELFLSLSQGSAREQGAFIQALQEARSNGAALDIRGYGGYNGETPFDRFLGTTSASSATDHGDFYMLWGDLDNAWTRAEYGRFYTISKWLVKNGFRNIVNPVAYERDVRAAVRGTRTVGMIWSSHGDKYGGIYDAGDQAPLADDVFSSQASPSFRHMVFGNCYGDRTVTRYRFPARVNYHYWVGTTSTEELFDYLQSKDWPRDLESDLGLAN